MPGKTEIAWADMVWNPTVGCTRVSPGCDHCYAFALHDQRYAAKRRGATLPAQYDRPFSQVQLLADRLAVPLRRRKPARYFVDSMADLFHQDVPDGYLDRVFASMALAPQHQFLVLTKRPERMRAYVAGSVDRLEQAVEDAAGDRGWHSGSLRWPLPHVWLGVSAEDQQRAYERSEALRTTPAAVHFYSCEPLLGPIERLPLEGISWVIVGGESGPHARPMNLAWMRSIVAQCRAADVAVFVKQLGSSALLRDRKGGDPAEWPVDLRVREWPQ